MFLETFEATNFKGLEYVKVRFEEGVNLIVGPNAVGKTTVLDAIRFVKAVLAPRTTSETFQTLSSLGAATQFNRNEIIIEALAGTPHKVVDVRCTFVLSPEDMDVLRLNLKELAEETLRSQTNFSGNLSSWIAFLSNFQGISMLKQVTSSVSQAIQNLQTGERRMCLGIICDPTTKQITSTNPDNPALFSFLEKRQSHRHTRFSYFPADRALPRGEQPVQLGTQDAQQTLESHSSQAELKYSRIKNHIFNALIEGEGSRKSISDEFAVIFNAVLKGKVLAPDAFGVNAHGQLSIRVADLISGRPFDIDQMSSGEKSLILTFLLISRSMADGGIVLLDEPELHLNPAVCKDVLNFLVEHYVIPKSLQVISCTHSPEIVAGAFARNDCHIYHLESGRLLAKARRQDQEEISEALRKLGSSEAESLLYPSTIFVEGASDIAILEAGFGDLLRRHKVKELGGRNEVEKAIKTFLEREKAGSSFPIKYFLFDLDRLPTSLASSKLVRLMQLKRRCIENYLLDFDSLTDLLKEDGACNKPALSVGRLEVELRQLALSQLHVQCIRDVYKQEIFAGLGMRSSDTDGKTVRECAETISARISAARESLLNSDTANWTSEFVSKVACHEAGLKPLWERNWVSLCDGKRLFVQLKDEAGIRAPLDIFKSRLMKEMGNRQAQGWAELKGILEELLGKQKR